MMIHDAALDRGNSKSLACAVIGLSRCFVLSRSTATLKRRMDTFGVLETESLVAWIFGCLI